MNNYGMGLAVGIAMSNMNKTQHQMTNGDIIMLVILSVFVIATIIYLWK